MYTPILNHDEIYQQLFINRKSVIHAQEGTGKSQIVTTLLKKFYKVVFFVETNDQVDEKFASYTKQGLNPQKIKSRASKLKDLGFNPVYETHALLFNTGVIDKEKTIKAIARSQGQAVAEAIWNQTKTDEMDFDNNLIIATRYQVNQIFGLEGEEWFAVFDDLNKNSLRSVAMLKANTKLPLTYERFNFEPEPGRICQFARRPEKFVVDHNVKIKTIFTTAESIVAEMVVKNLGANKIKLNAPPVKWCPVTLIGSIYTRKKQGDFGLPTIAANLRRRENLNVLAIGDNMNKMCPTHYAVKGNNDLSNNHLIVVIDQPAGEVMWELMAEFNVTDQEEGARLKVQLMVDTVKQSGSRSGWNRWNGSTDILVICDKSYVRRLSEALDYPHTLYANEVEARKAAKESDSIVFKEVAEFLTDPCTYLLKTAPKSKHFQVIQTMKAEKSWLSDRLIGFRDDLVKYIITTKQAKKKHPEDEVELKALDRLVAEINDLLNKGKV